MIVDTHCHVWPDALAARMVAGRPAGMDAVGDGTLDGLRRTMDTAGIDMACTLAIANEARHVPRTNEFIGSVDRSRFIPFGTVHTGLPVDANLASLLDNGIRAVKFHPNFQNLSLGDPAVVELFTALAEQGIVVLTHAGEGSDETAHERGAPKHIAALAASIPSLTLIACHFGGYHRLEEAERAVVGARVVLETSWPPALAGVEPDRVRRVIERHGPERVVFGTDWPMADPAAELTAIRSLGLAEQDERAVLGGNLLLLLGMQTTTKGTVQ